MSYKENQKASLISQMQERGLCDGRSSAFCATATSLPGGERGIVVLSVNENKLYISDIDFKNGVKELLYSVPLSKAENLKIRCSILSQVLRFTYQGCVYSFTNFLGVKPMLEVIKEEANRE